MQQAERRNIGILTWSFFLLFLQLCTSKNKICTYWMVRISCTKLVVYFAIFLVYGSSVVSIVAVQCYTSALTWITRALKISPYLFLWASLYNKTSILCPLETRIWYRTYTPQQHKCIFCNRSIFLYASVGRMADGLCYKCRFPLLLWETLCDPLWPREWPLSLSCCEVRRMLSLYSDTVL